MVEIKGFTSFSQNELNDFARGANWFQTALDRQHLRKQSKGFNYGKDMTAVYRHSETEFPSIIEYAVIYRTIRGQRFNHIVLELDKPERLRQFEEKTRHRILSILN